MKKILLALCATVFFGACSPVYYQVYQTKPVDAQSYSIAKEGVEYTDANCKVSYNFFTNGGDAGFELTNTTDKVLFVHLDQSFFVLNGMANDYFGSTFAMDGTERITSSSLNNESSFKEGRKNRVTRSQTIINTMSYSVSTLNGSVEKRVIAIPPHATKKIGNFVINPDFMELCGVKANPGRKSVGQSYVVDNSPLTFSNYISYTLGQSEDMHHFSTDFYISEILNVNGKSMITEGKKFDVCGKEISGKEGIVEIMSMETADRFFVKYRVDKEASTVVTIK